MTDPHASAGLANPGQPAPTFFDPSFERLPASVAGESATAGPVLLVFDRAADREWVADAAVALATGWHAAGRRTVLADLCLDDPFLSDRIGMPNQEGIVDIFLYGASLARSARAVPGRGFYLISAGTYTPEPADVLRSPRWEKIVGGFRDANAALLLFAPSDAPELASLARFADQAIVLGDGASGGALPPALAPLGVRAWLAPPRPATPAPAAPPASRAPADRFPEPEPVAPWNAPAGTYAPPAPAPDALPSGAGAAHVPASEIPAPEPEWADETAAAKKPARRTSPVLLILLLVAILAALLFLGPSLIPGFPDLLGGGGDDGTAQAATTKPAARTQGGPAVAQGEALPYSVLVKNYQTYDEAARSAADAARRFSEAQFFVVPEDDRGVTYWRVMAGMAGDTSDVIALRERLLAEKLIEEEAAGGRYALIQRRPLTFEVGEYADAATARAHADSLVDRAVPAYVAPVPFSDGSERWKVYAGAYRDSAGARPMKKVLDAARVPARMVERTSRPPASPK